MVRKRGYTKRRYVDIHWPGHPAVSVSALSELTNDQVGLRARIGPGADQRSLGNERLRRTVETKPEICVVMPAYNEAECIAPVITGIVAYFSARFAHIRIVVVNDGSRDETGQILDGLSAQDKRVVVIHQSNAGHGRALVRGYEEALRLQPEWIFQIDSDDQFDITDFDRLWALRDTSHFITGRRLERHDAPHRLVITRILRILNLLVFGAYIPDANIPFRLIQATYLARLLPLIPPQAFAPNIFLALIANASGEKLGQVPVTHKDRHTGQVSLVKWGLIKACLRTARELVLFRLDLARGLSTLRATAT